MLSQGSYVRLVMSPNTRMGTVSGEKLEDGERVFLFHHDERFNDILPDLYLPDYEMEGCRRPTDAEVEQINRLVSKE